MMIPTLEKIFNIANKCVMITGSTGYFGRYIAKDFLDCGAKVILLGRSEDLVRQSEKFQNDYGQDLVSGYQVDFYNRERLRKTLIEISKVHDVDVLINNAYDLSEKTGFNTTDGRLEQTEYELWRHAFDSGIYWAVLATQIIGEKFKKKKNGSIINISSMYGIVAPHPDLYEGEKYLNPPTYSVMKSGINALTKYTASFLGKYSVRCNSVAPGPFPNTESSSSNSVNQQSPFIHKLNKRTLLNRVGHPRDLSGVLIFLASDASSYITGQVVQVDGGWTVT